MVDDPMDLTKELDKESEPASYIHIHYQQISTKRRVTIIENIPSDIDLPKVLKAFKKLFSCNGTIVKDEIKGMVIQLQGDKRNEVSDFLIQEGIGTKSTVKIHG